MLQEGLCLPIRNVLQQKPSQHCYEGDLDSVTAKPGIRSVLGLSTRRILADPGSYYRLQQQLHVYNYVFICNLFTFGLTITFAKRMHSPAFDSGVWGEGHKVPF